jgi:esterase
VQATRASVAIDGRRISYLEWGVAHRNPIVLLHGGNSAAADWEDVATAFKDSYRVLAPDLRGRGFSDWDPGQDYTVLATLADVAAWHARLGLERVVIVGHSFGAVVGLAYAAGCPERVDRLVLLDGGPVSERSSVERSARRSPLAGIPLSFPNWEAAVAWQRARNPAIAELLQQRLADNHFVGDSDGRVTWRSDVAGQVKWSSEGDPQFDDQWPFVVAVQCPTLVVRGGASPLFGVAIATQMADTNRRIRVVEVAGAGHSVHHEKPSEVIAAVREFLAGD